MTTLAKTRTGAPGRSAKEAASSLLDIAYDEIKRRITICAFRPGDYLNEAEISTMLGIAARPCIRRSIG